MAKKKLGFTRRLHISPKMLTHPKKSNPRPVQVSEILKCRFYELVNYQINQKIYSQSFLLGYMCTDDRSNTIGDLTTKLNF